MSNILDPETRAKYTAVIGLEVHAQLSTKSKMFAPEAATYGSLPNTTVSAISLAHPGALPSINKRAIDYAIKMGLACKASITDRNLFARKNYFYPDLPKGYQISQHEAPICYAGCLRIDTESSEEKYIRIRRIHLEEDTGKSIHDMVPEETLLDYNRAGTPLIEIVTEPDLATAQEAYDFLYEVRKLVRYLDICDGNMEEGSLRCDANISVMPVGSTSFGSKVEVKNMNSMRHVQLAIEHEIERQIVQLEKGNPILSETRSYQAETGSTISQRSKEGVSDYRYFIDPDLSPVVVTEAWIAKIRADMPLLPRECFQKFVDSYRLPLYDAQVLTERKEIALFFDRLCQITPHYKMASNWMMGPVKSYLNECKMSVEAFPLSPETLARLIELIAQGKISFSGASQQLYPALLKEPSRNPEELACKLGLLQERDEASLERWVEAALAAYPDKVEAYRKGKKGLLGFFMGEVMKLSAGKADPKLTNTLLLQYLDQAVS